jgi:hypothetical protein
VNPLDRTAMASPAAFVDDELNGIVAGKMTPFEAADYLDKAATVSEDGIEQAAKLNPESAKNFDCIRIDIQGSPGWAGTIATAFSQLPISNSTSVPLTIRN